MSAAAMRKLWNLPPAAPLLPTDSLPAVMARIWQPVRIVDTEEEAEAINVAEDAAAIERADREEWLRERAEPISDASGHGPWGIS